MFYRKTDGGDITQLDRMQLVARSPEDLVFRHTNPLVGYLFIISGLIALTASLSTLAVGESGPLGCFSISCLCFFTAAFVCFQMGTTVRLDRSLRTITVIKKTATSEEREEYPFDAIKEVLYNVEDRYYPNRGLIRFFSPYGRGRAHDVWAVHLINVNGPDLCMGAQRFEEPMRARSEILAKFLMIPMRDMTSGEETVRMPGELDLQLVETMKKSGEETAVSPDPPAGSGIMVERASRYVRYVLTPRGIFGGSRFAIAFIMVVIGLSLFSTLRLYSLLPKSRHSEDIIICLAISLLVMLASLTVFVIMLKDLVMKRELTVTDELVRTSAMAGNWRFGRRQIPLEKVEEVVMSASPYNLENPDNSFYTTPVRIISDVGILRVGEGLSTGTLRWLRDSIRAEVIRLSGKA